mgnify:FL=1
MVIQRMPTIEQTILKNLVSNEDYTRKVLPFLKEDYFTDRHEKIVFDEINKFVDKYNKLPTIETLQIELQNRKSLNEQDFRKTTETLNNINIDSNSDTNNDNYDWLCDTTEKFCKDKAIYNAIVEGIGIIDGKDNDKRTPDSIPSILTDALAVSFDNAIGHDYIGDAESRFEFYNRIEKRIPFDLEFFNKITKGGLPPKTLNVALAGTGVGKSLFMCHMSANCLLQHKNVLYITLEMAEERIAERIDANMMSVSMEDLHDLPELMYKDRIKRISEKTNGQLVIKEYPTASAHVGHFRALTKELALKKSFKPDIIFIDYLNICTTSRFKNASNINSYSYVKAIAEELRGFAVEMNIPIVTATQTTRGGFSNTDIDLTDTSESFGLPATADLMFALISTEELEGLNQILVKQLKNRYNDPTTNKRFVVGIDRAKMKLYDVEQVAQTDLVDNETESNNSFKPTITHGKYEDFKV